MSTLKSSVCHAAVVCAVFGTMSSIAGAAFAVNRNGVTWAATYEGDTAALTASTPAWSVFDVANSSEVSDGNIRTHSTTSVAGTNSYSIGTNWSGTGGARTAEIRARVAVPDIAGVNDGQASFILGVVDAYDFRFTDHSILYNEGGSLTTATTLDTTQFHIYRVTINRTPAVGESVVNLYVDNSPTPVFSNNTPWFPGFDVLVYGDISTGGEAGSIEVDYIDWAAGVFAPAVPEPTSIALLSVGATALIRRRR